MTMTAGVREAPIVAAHPLLGSMNDLLKDPLGTYERARRDHGDVVRFRAGPPGLRADVYAVFSAEGAQQVLAGQAANFRKDNVFYEELRQSIGNGLLTSQDETYLRQRRLVQPLFTRRRVDGYAGQVADEARTLAAEWRAEGRDSVELVGEMHRFALRMVGRILFGTEMEKAFDVVERTLPPLQQYSLKRGLSPVKVPRAWPTRANREAARLQGELFALCDAIIDRRRGGAGDSEDLASLLVRAGNSEDGRLDADELREQVLIFLVAGHETTATALAFTLHLLARHPEEQRRVQEEVDRAPAAGDMEALPRLTMVVKEAMRLYPSAPVIGRRAVGDAEIDGVRIPAGADVIVCPWVTHRHPAYWADPERFDPGRFLPEAEAEAGGGRPRYAWFPFGGGPRACIGQHLSMLESVVGVAGLLRDFAFEDVEGEVPVGAGVTLMAKGAARVRISPRG